MFSCYKISCTPGFLRPSGENSASEKDNSEKEEPSDTTGESNSNAIGQPHPCIDRAIRVNYAGELAAVRMCAGRLSTLGKSEKLEVLGADHHKVLYIPPVSTIKFYNEFLNLVLVCLVHGVGGPEV